MDMNMIHSKLKEGDYDRLSEFIDDVSLMVGNGKKYFQVGRSVIKSLKLEIEWCFDLSIFSLINKNIRTLSKYGLLSMSWKQNLLEMSRN